jgi:energy-coupling factor transporter ATP-binding protein EcfA2
VCIGHIGGTGLTIEQRKRLTIAVELVANPSILFMDEPTTGLDARGAAVVMAVVRATAATGRTVVCTIHQPSAAIFEAFDELLLLKPGGRCIFSGPLGPEGANLISYFSSIAGVEPIKARFNPANWMLEQTAPMREKDLGVDFADIYESSAMATAADAVVAAAHEPLPGSKPLALHELNVRPPTVQFLVLLGRMFKMYWRLPRYTLIRGAVTILVAFVFGTIFWGKGQDYSGPATVLNISGVLFMSVLFVGVTNALTVQGVITEERRVFYRERAAGMYSALPFALAQSLVELPFLLVQSAVYVFPTYAMIGFRMEAGPLGCFFVFFTLTLWYFTEFGAACINVTPEPPIAVLLTSFL